MTTKPSLPATESKRLRAEVIPIRATTEALQKRDSEIVEFIAAFTLREGRTPSQREIAASRPDWHLDKVFRSLRRLRASGELAKKLGDALEKAAAERKG